MNILGISCWYHDSAAALLIDGEIIAAAAEERFSRKKHDFEFPFQAVEFCLARARIDKSNIDYVVFYDKPIVKAERIISSILHSVPRSLQVFRQAGPLWLTKKLKFHKTVKKNFNLKPEKVFFSSHHMAHSASSFFLSPFRDSAVLNLDGVGEWATASFGLGKGNKVRLLKEMRFPHSLGLLYSVFTAFLGFKVNNGEYKVMGMSPYGKPRYTDNIYKTVKVNDDGSIKLNMDYFSFNYSASRSFSSKFIKLFGEPRKPGSLFCTEKTGFPPYLGEKPKDYSAQLAKNEYYADIAASIQQVLEDILIKIARHVKEETGAENLCYAGGVALNSKANFKLLKSGLFKNIFIQPAATDAGGALGAALWMWCQILNKRRPAPLKNIYLGKSSDADEIKAVLKDNNLIWKQLKSKDICSRAARAISRGKVVGWYQGRAEWGPRALGNRSILADPRNPEMKNIVNSKIKFREPFRPFAPSILSKDVDEFIIRKKERSADMFMLSTYPVKRDKIIPAVTHADGSSRIQSVKRENNPLYWELINSFKDITGVGVLLNTSFNLKGEPIVNSPSDAVKTFLKSGIDLLVMDNFWVEKRSAADSN